MIDFNTYLAFVVVSVGIIVLPGPNVLLIVATGISNGIRSALVTVLGTSTAMLLQLLVAAIGTALLAHTLADAFAVIKWLGVAYLLWLGINHLRALSANQPQQAQPPEAAAMTFWRGFFVSMTNPKTILFFGAFLPQFVDPAVPLGTQLTLLSATFLVLAAVLDSCYALAAHSLARFVRRPSLQRWRHGISGGIFLGAGLVLALTRRQ
jgi:homoserine/homoserine lactone efflux protein